MDTNSSSPKTNQTCLQGRYEDWAMEWKEITFLWLWGYCERGIIRWLQVFYSSQMRMIHKLLKLMVHIKISLLLFKSALSKLLRAEPAVERSPPESRVCISISLEIHTSVVTAVTLTLLRPNQNGKKKKKLLRSEIVRHKLKDLPQKLVVNPTSQQAMQMLSIQSEYFFAVIFWLQSYFE